MTLNRLSHPGSPKLPHFIFIKTVLIGYPHFTEKGKGLERHCSLPNISQPVREEPGLEKPDSASLASASPLELLESSLRSPEA